MSMFFPRAAPLFELVQHVYEAQALWSFGMLIFDLASDGETDQVLAREVLLAKLALQEPKKLDASPPLCFLAPFVKAVRVDGHRLDSIMEGLRVFGIVVPACAVVRLWINLEAKNVWVRGCDARAAGCSSRARRGAERVRSCVAADHLGLAGGPAAA